MSTRIAKKLIYGAFYAVVWVLVIGTGYHLLTQKAVSCFDKIQDQGETGIDCGGPCSLVCTPSAQPISTLSFNTFALPGSHATFLAKIANPNVDFAVQSFSFSFNVYDASGALIQSYPSQSYLFSQQVKYLLLANQVIPDGGVREDITITNPTWVTATAFGTVPQFAVQNISTLIGSTTVITSGQLANNDSATFNNVFMVAVFKDASGDAIAASQTVLDTIQPNQTENFSVSYPVIGGIDPALTEVSAYAFRQ